MILASALIVSQDLLSYSFAYVIFFPTGTLVFDRDVVETCRYCSKAVKNFVFAEIDKLLAVY